jgi:CelD/BcsL family acetyltransferase involved in cellulose biosynthesis
MNSFPENIQGLFLKTLEGEDVLREEWNQLVLQMEVPQVFFTYEWALAVECSFRSSTEPLIFTLRRNNALIGVAALAHTPSDPREVFFMGASTADYCDIVSAPQDRSLVVMELLRALRRSDARKVSLASIPHNSATIETLSQARSSGYWSSSRPAYICSRIVFKRDAEDIAPKSLISARTKEKLRRLSKFGPVKLVHLRARDEAFAVLDSIVKAQVSRFLATFRTSPLLLEERRRFLAELIGLLSQRRWLDVSLLKVGEREVAWNLGFQFEGISFWYLPTFDISMESLSPGACLLGLMTEEGRNERNLKEIDLGLGDEGYKARIANDSRATLSFTLSLHVIMHAKFLIREALGRLVKASSFCERSARSFLHWADKVTDVVRREGIGKIPGLLLKKLLAKAFWHDEIVFFEWQRSAPNERAVAGVLKKIDWEILAKSALDHCEDVATIEYLKRSAQRLKHADQKCCQGFVLTSEAGAALHYCWTIDFSGFELGEIQHKLPILPNAQMIFDCWTPNSMRGMHYYAAALECVAHELNKQGKFGWIFSSTQNAASLNALKKSSFVPRYSIIRRKLFFRMPVEKLPVITAEAR